MINSIVNIVNEFKTALQKDNDTEDSLLDKIVIVDGYNRELTEQLLREEHNRRINIHNLDEYINIVERNDKRFHELNIWLHNQHHRDYQKEVLKEIALEQMFKKKTLREIDELIKKHENPTKWGILNEVGDDG